MSPWSFLSPLIPPIILIVGFVLTEASDTAVSLCALACLLLTGLLAARHRMRPPTTMTHWRRPFNKRQADPPPPTSRAPTPNTSLDLGATASSQNVVIVPFGTYVTGHPVQPPNNATLIGREEQRTRFLDRLRNHGAPGAYLITGQRGAGKTSFVRESLAQYRRDVFPRFLRSGIDRAVFWDRLVVLLIGVLAAVGFLLASELLHEENHAFEHGQFSATTVFLLPVVAICGLPILYSYRLIHTLVSVIKPFDHNRLIVRVVPLAIILLFGLAAAFLPAFSEAPRSMSALLLLLSALTTSSTWQPTDRAAATPIRRFLPVAVPLLLWVLWASLPPPRSVTGDSIYFFELALSAALGFTSLLFAAHRADARSKAKAPDLSEDQSLRNIYVIGATAAAATTLTLFHVALSQSHYSPNSTIAGVASILLPLGLLTTMPYIFRKQSSAVSSNHSIFSLTNSFTLLGFKAFLAFVTGVQYLSPMLKKLAGVTEAAHCRAPLPVCNPDLFYGKFTGPPQLVETHGQALWGIGLLLILTFLFHVEYDWIFRRPPRSIQDASPPPSGERDTAPRSTFHEGEHHQQHHRILEKTLPWQFYNAWLPIVVVPVNLGVDRLHRRSVIHAMLTGLRRRYAATFLSWNSGLGALFRVSRVGFILLLTTFIWKSTVAPASMSTESWRLWSSFLPVNNPGFWDTEPLGQYVAIFSALLVAAKLVGYALPFLPYRTNWRRLGRALDRLSARTRDDSKRRSALNLLGGSWLEERISSRELDPANPRVIEYEFIGILDDIQRGPLGGKKYDRHIALSIPVPEVIFVFDELDKLGVPVPFVDPETGDSDKRAGLGNVVDLAGARDGTPEESKIRLLQLNALLAEMKNLMSTAAAHFVFVGGRDLHDEWLVDQTKRVPLLANIFNSEIYLPSFLVDPTQRDIPPWRSRIDQYLDLQEERARRIFDLSRVERTRSSLALVNLHVREPRFLSTSGLPSRRYVFRDIHIYKPGQPQPQVDRTVQDSRTARHSLAAQTEEYSEKDWHERLSRDFVQFLTYRSMGNPKRLKDLLETFIQPSRNYWKRNLNSIQGTLEPAPADHVLAFDEAAKFRLQMIADVYRFLALGFESQFRRRDDKIVAALFFLADFLFKFHGRAFAWASLEKMEELVHIHRAPDLWATIEKLVKLWSEPFFHQILNGLYSFRFRSDMSREIAYISRQSPLEMAAFNFTLDESQALKAQYKRRVESMGVDAPADLIASLGDLHDFDQEFDLARYYYQRSIRRTDQEFADLFGDDYPGEDGTARRPSAAPARAIRSWRTGRADSRQMTTWASSRLSLMLKIGMTYERSDNLKAAAVHYRDAQTLARSSICAMLGISDFATAASGSPPSEIAQAAEATRIHSLKQMTMLFQPVFADAWVTEKMFGAVDASISLVEVWLWECRLSLPFARIADPVPRKESANEPSDSSFALILAELHNKAGDLLFFKGAEIGGVRAVEDLEAGEEGYLMRAHYHYSVGLHDIRRFISHRQVSSRECLGLRGWEHNDEDAAAEGPPISAREGWPEFVYRALGSGLADISESMWARVSLQRLLGLVEGRANTNTDDGVASATATDAQDTETVLLSGEDWAKHAEHYRTAVGEWLSHTHPSTSAFSPDQLPKEFFGHGLADWHGLLHGVTRSDQPRSDRPHRSENWPADGDVLRFSCDNHDLQRLVVGLHQSVLGAKYLERAGYLEDSARELLQVADMVTQFFWWSNTYYSLCKRRGAQVDADHVLGENRRWYQAPKASDHERGIWQYLGQACLSSLERASRSFERARSRGKGGGYVVGEKIPVRALVLGCSLALAVRRNAELRANTPPQSTLAETQRLARLLWRWTGDEELEQISTEGPPPKGQSSLLEHALAERATYLLDNVLRRHAYPMRGRLSALKVLLDNTTTTEGDLSDGQVRNARIYAEELLRLRADFDSPLHFTPFDIGTSLAQLCLRATEPWVAEPPFPEWIGLYRAAMKFLNRSEEMISMRRAYYDAISNLYYLYDDFNDRSIHFNHAVQMAGRDLAGLFKNLLRGAEDPHRWGRQETGDIFPHSADFR